MDRCITVCLVGRWRYQREWSVTNWPQSRLCRLSFSGMRREGGGGGGRCKVVIKNLAAERDATAVFCTPLCVIVEITRNKCLLHALSNFHPTARFVSSSIYLRCIVPLIHIFPFEAAEIAECLRLRFQDAPPPPPPNTTYSP